jgi:hypothetical protein
MSILFKASILVLLVSPYALSQDPMPVVSSSWQRTTQKAQQPTATGQIPARGLTNDDKYFQRKAREGRTDITIDPTETTVDARSAAMERAVQESRVSKADDVTGYSYVAEVRNDSGKTVEVIFWEYRFAEIARPSNVVRRQFLCGTKLKKGEKRQLPAFSLLGPSDAIGVESLAKPAEKLFNEEVLVNRIEFSDGSILQRADWKFADVKASVERITSAPWGKEICRGL